MRNMLRKSPSEPAEAPPRPLAPWHPSHLTPWPWPPNPFGGTKTEEVRGGEEDKKGGGKEERRKEEEEKEEREEIRRLGTWAFEA